jgi:hypothetical protein
MKLELTSCTFLFGNYKYVGRQLRFFIVKTNDELRSTNVWTPTEFSCFCPMVSDAAMTLRMRRVLSLNHWFKSIEL